MIQEVQGYSCSHQLLWVDGPDALPVDAPAGLAECEWQAGVVGGLHICEQQERQEQQQGHPSCCQLAHGLLLIADSC